MNILSSLIKFFDGRAEIYADAENKDALLSFFVSSGISVETRSEREKGGIYAEISPGLLKKIAPALDKLNIMVYIINIYGFKRLCSKYGTRYGLMLGAAAFAVLLWLSTLFVWRVDVIGNDALSKEELRAELSELGVSVGVELSDIERSAVADTLLKQHPELSWAALNFKGTTVTLTVKETAKVPESTEQAPCRVLVAAESGVVKSVLAYEGHAAVKPGAVVNKGDVLITGFISDSADGIPQLRLTDARGSVKAEVVRTVEAYAPFTEERVHFENGKRCGTVISVFGHTFSFGSTEGAAMDSERYVTFFGVVEIPVTVRALYEKKAVSSVLSEDSETARLTAERRLYKKITETLGDGELTFVKVEYTETEDGWLARAELGCAVEIAVPYTEYTEK